MAILYGPTIVVVTAFDVPSACPAAVAVTKLSNVLPIVGDAVAVWVRVAVQLAPGVNAHGLGEVAERADELKSIVGSVAGVSVFVRANVVLVHAAPVSLFFTVTVYVTLALAATLLVLGAIVTVGALAVQVGGITGAVMLTVVKPDLPPTNAVTDILVSEVTVGAVNFVFATPSVV